MLDKKVSRIEKRNAQCNEARIMYNEYRSALIRVQKTFKHANQKQENRKVKLLQPLVEVKEKRKKKSGHKSPITKLSSNSAPQQEDTKDN